MVFAAATTVGIVGAEADLVLVPVTQTGRVGGVEDSGLPRLASSFQKGLNSGSSTYLPARFVVSTTP